MIKETEVIREPYPLISPRRISWSAIFAGALVGVGLSFLLNLFALAIGLTAFNLNHGGAVVLAVGGLIGIIIGLIVSMVVAGYTAGYLGRLYCPRRNHGIVYGFTTWCVALLLTAFVSAHIHEYVTTYSSNLAGSVVVVPDQNATNTTSNVQTTPTNAANAESTPAHTANQTLTVNVPTKTLAWSAFIVFILFFIGAVASCFGACWGMSCKRED